MNHNTWTFTARRITDNRITAGFSFAWYPKSEKTTMYGWGEYSKNTV